MTLNIEKAKNVDSDAKSDLKEILGNRAFFRLIAIKKWMFWAIEKIHNKC